VVTVGYFSLQSLWRFHLVHELELMEADLEQGCDVHVIHPGKSLRFSDTSPRKDHALRVPVELSRLRYGLSLLSGRVTRHSVDQLLEPSADRVVVPRWKSANGGRAALGDLRFGGHDCGNAVLSSLIWHTRNTAVDLGEYEPWIRRALDTSIKVYLAAKRFIEIFRPDRVYVFNGRMATFRGALRACQELGVECLVHERGATLDRIGLTPNTMPHDIFWVQQEILRHWEASNEDESTKREIGRAFYQRKRGKQVFNWKVYTEKQESNRLPSGLDAGKPVYSIFTSSEYERFALPQYYRYLLHDSQLEGIRDLVSILRDHHFEGTLCVRLHPNSHDERPDLLEGLRRSVAEDFVRIIPADSPVDSYALIDVSDKVLTFGSTMAMEAAYWGKPSVSFATNPYQNLDAVYQPADREDAVRLIVEPLPAKGGLDCLKYGYFYSTFGRKMRYSEARDLSSLTFKGRAIRETYVYRHVGRRYHKLINRFRRSIRSPQEE
jgi:hypothetical protein